jgi:hypothetical protein
VPALRRDARAAAVHTSLPRQSMLQVCVTTDRNRMLIRDRKHLLNRAAFIIVNGALGLVQEVAVLMVHSANLSPSASRRCGRDGDICHPAGDALTDGTSVATLTDNSRRKIRRRRHSSIQHTPR